MTPEREYISRLFSDSPRVELRVLGESSLSGVFDDQDKFMDAARQADGTGGVYSSLNALSPDVPVTNRIQRGNAPRDPDYVRIIRIPLDFDPVRATGESSTDLELALAFSAMGECREYLHHLGWPDPVWACSGNGYHLQYAVDLPNDQATKELLERIYKALALRFDLPEVSFDMKVRNASRIFRLYGTQNVKGTPTAERPHRRSFCRIPTVFKQVAPDQLQLLADSFIRPASVPFKQDTGSTFKQVTGSGDYSTLDAVAWFTAHGQYRRPLGTYNGAARHAVRCPFESEHSSVSTDTDTSTVIFENATGWPGFVCQHSHCEGRSIKDVLQVFGDADHFCTRPFKQEESHVKRLSAACG